MIRLNSGDELAALMRVQIASLRRKTELGQASRPKTGAAPVHRQKNATTTDLASAAADRIRNIQPDDPHKSQKAVRIFLESVLLAELGPNLIADPEFARMVDHVQHQLESNPEIARATQEAADVLLKSAHG